MKQGLLVGVAVASMLLSSCNGKRVEDSVASKSEADEDLVELNNLSDSVDINDAIIEPGGVERKICFEEALEVGFHDIESIAQSPGGEDALLKWISGHIIYPQEALEKGIQGHVTVRFLVKNDGSIGEVSVIRGIDPNLDKEAVRVVRSLPKFTPAIMLGKPVSMYFTLPINFKLKKEE